MDIKLHIPDPILRSYFCGRFKAHGDGFIVGTDNMVGLALSTLVTRAPVSSVNIPEETDDTVLVFLSKSRHNEQSRGKYLYLTLTAEKKVNAILKQEFDTTFTAFCTEAKVCGFKNKDIIEAFIGKYDMNIFEGDIDTLKKRYYRYELVALQKLREKLRQKSYYAVQKVSKTMRASVL